MIARNRSSSCNKTAEARKNVLCGDFKGSSGDSTVIERTKSLSSHHQRASSPAMLPLYPPIGEVTEADTSTASSTRRYPMGLSRRLAPPTHNMNQPLSAYYISSSHNTYLEGNQLSSRATVESYVLALRRGAKCLEIDTHDDVKTGEPKVTHGMTMCGETSLRKVLTAINEHAFDVSPYPIIISLEDHCSVTQQRVMAAMFREIFGERLYVEPFDYDVGVLPSPEDLKHQVLLKNYRLVSEGPALDPDLEAATKYPSLTSQAPELGEIVTLCQGARIAHLANSISSLQPVPSNRFFTMGEAHLPKLQAQRNDMVRFTQSHNVKIMPKGMRFTSSNPDPRPYWMLGCQVVALNFQDTHIPMWLNQALFETNGSCGYVLKPSFLRSPSEIIDEESALTLQTVVLSCRDLPYYSGPKDIVDPLVKVLLFDGALRCSKDQNTPFILDNPNPIWTKNNVFSFNIVHPSMSFLSFIVMDKDFLTPDDFVAQYTIALPTLLKKVLDSDRDISLPTSTIIDSCMVEFDLRDMNDYLLTNEKGVQSKLLVSLSIKLFDKSCPVNNNSTDKNKSQQFGSYETHF